MFFYLKTNPILWNYINNQTQHTPKIFLALNNLGCKVVKYVACEGIGKQKHKITLR